MLSFMILFYILGSVTMLKLSGKIGVEIIISSLIWPLLFVIACLFVLIGSLSIKDIERLNKDMKE